MTTKSTTSASDGQQKQIVRLVEEVGQEALKELGLTKDDAQRLLGKGGEFKKELATLLVPVVRRFSMAPNIVLVPDLAAVDLTALVKKDLNLTYLDADYARWNYYRDNDGKVIEGRGKKFEAMIYKPELGPNDVAASEAVRAYFRGRGFSGHAGAFTQWRRQNPGLMGYHASVLEDNACWRDSDGRLYVPYSFFDGDDRKLDRDWVGRDWDAGWSFVAFREVS